MRIRAAITCSLVLTLAATTSPALAAKKKKPAPKPLCLLLVDAKGDGYATTGGAVLRSPAMDFHSADVATGKKTVVGTMRLETTNTANDPVAALGMTWNLSFKVRGQTYSFQRRRVAGTAARYEYSAPGNELKVAENATEVRFEIPRSAIPELKKPKMVLDTIAVSGTVFTTNADFGGTQKVYPDLAPSCLKPQ